MRILVIFLVSLVTGQSRAGVYNGQLLQLQNSQGLGQSSGFQVVLSPVALEHHSSYLYPIVPSNNLVENNLNETASNQQTSGANIPNAPEGAYGVPPEGGQVIPEPQPVPVSSYSSPTDLRMGKSRGSFIRPRRPFSSNSFSASSASSQASIDPVSSVNNVPSQQAAVASISPSNVPTSSDVAQAQYVEPNSGNSQNAPNTLYGVPGGQSTGPVTIYARPDVQSGGVVNFSPTFITVVSPAQLPFALGLAGNFQNPPNQVPVQGGGDRQNPSINLSNQIPTPVAYSYSATDFGPGTIRFNVFG